MDVQIVQSPPIRVVLLRHRGPYDGLAPVFDRLWEWVEAERVPVRRTLGAYWDNPEFVPAFQLRSAACVEVPDDFALGETRGLPLEIDRLLGGQFATTRFVGPYEELARVWAETTRIVEGRLGRTITDDPAIEVYVNDASETPAHALVTELYMPVR